MPTGGREITVQGPYNALDGGMHSFRLIIEGKPKMVSLGSLEHRKTQHMLPSSECLTSLKSRMGCRIGIVCQYAIKMEKSSGCGKNTVMLAFLQLFLK